MNRRGVLLGLAAVAVLSAIVLHPALIRTRLDQTARIFLNETLSIPNVSLDAAKYEAAVLPFGDPVAIWALQTPDIARLKTAAERKMAPADLNDRDWFASVVAEAFGAEPIKNGTLHLYRTDTSLGPGTVCPDDQCAVYLMMNDADAWLQIITF